MRTGKTRLASCSIACNSLSSSPIIHPFLTHRVQQYDFVAALFSRILANGQQQASYFCEMLTENEAAFVQYWEHNRSQQKKGIYQLLVGLPVGLLLSGVIAFNFYSGWYKQADAIANGPRFNPIVLIVALLMIAVFVAVFSKKFQWEQREQKYQELLIKKDKSEIPKTETE